MCFFLLFSYKFVWLYVFSSKDFFKNCDVNIEAFYLVAAVCWMIMKQDLVHALFPIASFSVPFQGLPRRDVLEGCGGFFRLGGKFLGLCCNGTYDIVFSPCPIMNVKFLY